jgi:hypothetical protein
MINNNRKITKIKAKKELMKKTWKGPKLQKTLCKFLNKNQTFRESQAIQMTTSIPSVESS